MSAGTFLYLGQQLTNIHREAVMAKDEKAADNTEGKKSNKTLLIIIAVMALLVLGGGAAGVYFFVLADSGTQDKAAEVKKKEEKAEAIYYTIKPTFMVKIGKGKKTRYLQVDVAVMARDPVIIEAVKQHRPLIMNDLLAMFAHSDYPTLISVKGKRKLQLEGMEKINAILKREENFTGVRAVLFTTFMVQ